MNTQAFQALIALQLGAADAAARSYEVGLIQNTPVPDLSGPQGTLLGELAMSCVHLNRNLDTVNETSHVFYLPALLRACGDALVRRVVEWQKIVSQTEQQIAVYQHEIEEIAFRLYGIECEDRRSIIEESLQNEQQDTKGNIEEAENEEESDEVDTCGLVAALLSYMVGCAFGRWNVYCATGERPMPALPDPFTPLPVCSPAMLTDNDGLPLHESLAGYPLTIKWDGVLVDDPDHPDDIVRRVRDVIAVIWHEQAESIEQEACQMLGVKELRDYFRRPGNGGFWTDHIQRYSKSRRKAPIYWLLQSAKRNYAVWLYYHRLTKDTLFKVLHSYVDPKLRKEEMQHEQLRSQLAAVGTSGREAKQLERHLERQENLLSELEDFREKLRRVADLNLEPDLNDGVVLTIAPLRELVPWNEAKKYWEELVKGKYEWSSVSKQLRERGMV